VTCPNTLQICPAEGILLRDGQVLSVSPRTFDTPDGKKLAVATAGDLSVLEGQKIIAKVRVGGEVWNPRWSPDGTRIRYSILTPNDATLWEVDANAAGPTDQGIQCLFNGSRRSLDHWSDRHNGR